MRSRIIVSVVGVPILLYVVLLAPEWVMVVALAILSGFAAGELMECVGAKTTSLLLCRLTVYCATWAVLCAAYCPKYLLLTLTVYCLAAFAIGVWKGGTVKFAQLMAGVFSAIGLPYTFTAFLRIDDAGHRGYLLLPFVFSFLCDTCAFFAGRAFGRHKLAPRVSPHKTVEGAVGGLLGSLGGALVFVFIMNGWFGQSLSYLWMALSGLLCGVIAQLGDLTFSLIKREFGIKDYGKIFFAHGGVLDRFDSVVFVAPVVALILPYLT